MGAREDSVARTQRKYARAPESMDAEALVLYGLLLDHVNPAWKQEPTTPRECLPLAGEG